MTRYLLDTDICIEIIKHNNRVLDKVETVGEEKCFVTSNLKHFDHIPGIQLEDWAQKSKYKKQ